MLEPIAERLSRFTPDGSGLDRDALLFAAGQASVRRPGRPVRGWGVAVGALAASQLLTLVLLWPGPKTAVGPLAKGLPPAETPFPDALAIVPDATSLCALNRRALESKNGDLPPGASVDRLVAADPPLRAWAGSSPTRLD